MVASIHRRDARRYYPELVATREVAGRPLPQYVKEEFEAYLKCGRLEHGFLRARCGGRLRVIASIEQPELIARILTHRRERGEDRASFSPLGPRAPPQAALF